MSSYYGTVNAFLVMCLYRCLLGGDDMVCEGKRAKVIACKEAEVKGPVPGDFRMPVKKTAVGRVASYRRAEEAKVVSAISIQGKEKKVVCAPVRNGEKRAREVISAQIQDGERRVREVVPAQIKDGEAGAESVYSASIQAGGEDAAHVVPASVQKVEPEEGVLQELPEMAEENRPTVQERRPARAGSGLTLAQLFSEE